jgi:hypothetical protein
MSGFEWLLWIITGGSSFTLSVIDKQNINQICLKPNNTDYCVYIDTVLKY